MEYPLNQQILARRKSLSISQDAVGDAVGMSQQQYSRIEAGGECKSGSLTRIAEGLNCEIILVPNEKLKAVMALLDASNLKAAVKAIKSVADGGATEKMADVA